MPSINKSALVAFSAKQMYDLVNDVAAYQTFLPGCRLSQVLESSNTHMKAKMVLAKGGIQQELITENTLIEYSSIQMHLSQGPFKSLTGGWLFTPLSDEACKIELNLEFTFASKLVDMAFGKVFKSLTNNMIQAFGERAKEVYK